MAKKTTMRREDQENCKYAATRVKKVLRLYNKNLVRIGRFIDKIDEAFGKLEDDSPLDSDLVNIVDDIRDGNIASAQRSLEKFRKVINTREAKLNWLLDSIIGHDLTFILADAFDYTIDSFPGGCQTIPPSKGKRGKGKRGKGKRGK